MKTCTTCGKEWPDEFRLCPSDGSSLRASSATAEDLVDSIIADRYHVTKKLGQGGMGAVYLAEHVKMGQQAAIKVITRALASDPAAIARFTREARNAARIKHPNVCTIHDFGETADGLIYMAMEFIEGESLADMLQREGRLPLGRAASILMQCCDALQAAHDLDIVHRDIKPENIMIMKARDGTDVVKVVDFGIAKAVTGESGQTVTQTGFIVGTPDYMSPDQVSGEILDGRSDIYSLAVVFFRMVTGILPFQSGTPQDALMARIGAEPQKLREALPNAGFPPDLQQALDSALAQRRENRYATAIEFGRAIVQSVQGETGTMIAPSPSLSDLETRQLKTPQPTRAPSSATGPATPETPQPALSPAGAKKRKGVPVGALVGAVVVIGAAAVVWQVTSKSGTPAIDPADTTDVVVVGENGDKENEEGKPDEVTTGTVSISGLPEGGTIIAMGRELESPFALPAGEHEIELRAPGYESKTVAIDVVAGERMTVLFAARRIETARADPPPPEPEPEAAVRRTVALGQTVSGALSTSDRTRNGRFVQAWSLRGTAGQEVDITLRSEDFDTYLYLTGPGMEQLEDDDAAGSLDSRITTTLPRNGTYTVLAAALREGETGPYTLSVTARVSLGSLSPGSRRLNIGETVGSRLTTSAQNYEGRLVQAWALRAAAGTQVEITMRSEEFDAFLYLTGPGLDEPLTNDDGGGGRDARIRTTLARGGTYLVIASHFSAGATGAYTLGVTPPGEARLSTRGRTLTIGQSRQGTLTESDQEFGGRRVQAWAFEAPPGTRIDIELTSGAYDTYLFLAGPGIDEPITNDDGGEGANSRISTRLTEGGTYYALASSYSSDATGPYTISVNTLPGLEQFPKDGRVLSVGTSVGGTLTTSDPVYEGRHVKVFELRVAAGTRLQIGTQSQEFDTYLYLTGPGLAEPLSDDDGGEGTGSRLVATLERGGTYFVAVGGFNESAVGAFRLAVGAARQ